MNNMDQLKTGIINDVLALEETTKSARAIVDQAEISARIVSADFTTEALLAGLGGRDMPGPVEIDSDHALAVWQQARIDLDQLATGTITRRGEIVT